MIRFFVPGEPVGKGRPRIGQVRGRAMAFTPRKTVDYENLVKMVASQAMAGSPPLEGPVSLTVNAVFSVPQSWSKKRQAAALEGKIRPTGRPDIDNAIKAISDGLNKIVFRDDSQVVHVSAVKIYGLVPGVHVDVVGL